MPDRLELWHFVGHSVMIATYIQTRFVYDLVATFPSLVAWLAEVRRI